LSIDNFFLLSRAVDQARANCVSDPSPANESLLATLTALIDSVCDEALELSLPEFPD